MAATGGKRASERLLLCRVGAKLCALPLERLLETMRPLPAEPLPQLPGYVRGVAVIRGRPTPVVDARQLLGSATDAAPRRYVTLDSDGSATRILALAVDDVVGVRDVPERLLAELPSLLRGAADPVRAVGALDSELWWLLEAARLVPEEVWQQLTREQAAK